MNRCSRSRRMPLSAYIPARRRIKGQDEFLSRPRFLAISEFGPRSIIYHEGSRYIVNKVILPLAEGDEPLTTAAKQCVDCGYMHELSTGEAGPGRCENCESARLSRVDSLLRLQNVSTKRRDRINSDEEDRLKMGYEIRTGLRFKEVGGLGAVPGRHGHGFEWKAIQPDLWRCRELGHQFANEMFLAIEQHEVAFDRYFRRVKEAKF